MLFCKYLQQTLSNIFKITSLLNMASNLIIDCLFIYGPKFKISWEEKVKT